MTHKNLVCLNLLCPVEALKVVYAPTAHGHEVVALVHCPGCSEPMVDLVLIAGAKFPEG